MNEYAIVIAPLSEDDGGGFIGFVPDLPGCMSDGETRTETLENTEAAMKEWLDIQNKRGVEIPAPGEASEIAVQREEQLLDAILSLAEYREQVEAENKGLKRKLAELISILRTDSSDKLPRINVSGSLSRLKPSRPH